MSYMLRAVIVGIDEYVDTRHRNVSNLQCARNDAQAIANVLRTSTAFGREADSPHLLTNAQASRRAVRRAIDTCFSSHGLDRKTIALFYFAGHGILKNERVFLCCHDVDFYDPEQGGFRLNEVYDWLKECSAECAIAIIDACFSGGLTTRVLSHVSAAEHAKRAIVDVQAPDGKSIAILAACRSDQPAREDPRLGHGLFTHQILLGLRDDSQARGLDGTVTLARLIDYLSDSFAHERHQKPKFSYVLSDPIPLWKGTPLSGMEAPSLQGNIQSVTLSPIISLPPLPDIKPVQPPFVLPAQSQLPPPINRDAALSSVPEFHLEDGSPKSDYWRMGMPEPEPLLYPPTSNVKLRKGLILFGLILFGLLLLYVVVFLVFKH